MCKITLLLWKMSWNDPMKWPCESFLLLKSEPFKDLWEIWLYKSVIVEKNHYWFSNQGCCEYSTSTAAAFRCQVPKTASFPLLIYRMAENTNYFPFKEKMYFQWTNLNATSAFSLVKTPTKKNQTQNIFSHISYCYFEEICTNSVSGLWSSQLHLQQNHFQDIIGKSVLLYGWILDDSFHFYLLSFLSALNVMHSLMVAEQTAPHWNTKSCTQWIFPACKIPLTHQWNTCFLNENETPTMFWHYVSRFWITIYCSGWMLVQNPSESWITFSTLQTSPLLCWVLCVNFRFLDSSVLVFFLNTRYLSLLRCQNQCCNKGPGYRDCWRAYKSLNCSGKSGPENWAGLRIIRLHGNSL